MNSTVVRVNTLATIGFFALSLGCSTEHDRASARALASRVHDEMRLGAFASIYNESAPRFRTVGSESEFVAMMGAFQVKVGVLKHTKEVAYETHLDSSVGKTHVLVFDLEYDHGHALESLIFVRSETGEMQLWKLDIRPID